MDTFTATEWVNMARTAGTRKIRAEALRQFCVANDFDGEVGDGLSVPQADKIVEAVRAGTLTPYGVANSFAQKLLTEKKAPGTVRSRLQIVKQFFTAMDVAIKPDLWKNRVVQVRKIVLRRHETFTREQITKILTVAPIKAKAVVAFLASTGWRPEELPVLGSAISVGTSPPFKSISGR